MRKITGSSIAPSAGTPATVQTKPQSPTLGARAAAPQSTPVRAGLDPSTPNLRHLPKAAAPQPRTLAGVAQKMTEAVGRLSPSVAGAALGAGMTAMLVGAPVQAQTHDIPVAISESILNPAGAHNPSGSTELFRGTRLERAPDTQVQLSPDGVQNPNSVMVQGGGGTQEVQRLVSQGASAESIAQSLARQFGPFTSSNSEANRQAIVQNLRWLGGTGIRYDYARADSSDVTTQSPNQTLSTRSGVCRDTHTALSAIIASLMNARQVNGEWVPGSPTGQEANVQTSNFATPNEHHAFTVFRDPGTGGWDALEYGKSYDLNAPTAADAFRALPNHVPGYSTYRITGWDSKPVVADHVVVDAAAARAFFTDNPGVGEQGEVRATGSADGGQITAFINPNLSITGAARESDVGGLDGGLKLNYHRDLVSDSGQGFVRYGAGVYSTGFEATDTGRRGEGDREALRTYVLGVKYDSRWQSNPRPIIGERLQYRYGWDTDMLLAVPYGPEGFVLGNVQDYSNIDVGLDGALLGRERLSPNLTFDWAVQARYELDVMNLSNELWSSDASSFRAAGGDALRTDFAMALTHQSDSGLTTRLEGGGTYWMASPLDPQVQGQGSHYGVLTVRPRDGDFDFGVMARGRTMNGETTLVDGLGVALRLTPNDNLSVGVSVDASMPGGDWNKIGDNVSVIGALNYRF